MNQLLNQEKNLVPKIPPRILIDIHSNCNLSCPQCLVHGRKHDPRCEKYKNKVMSLNQVFSIIDEIMESKPLIIPSLWSEPLLYPYFIDFCNYVKSKDIPLSINTNGLLLNEKMANFLVEIKFDSVIISVDAVSGETLKKVRGFSNITRLIKNIDYLLQLRGHNTKPRIGVSMTLQSANKHEKQDFLTFWTEKVDYIRFGTYFDGNTFASDNSCNYVSRIPCSDLYSTMAIHADGNVSICCLDIFQEYNVGNVFDEGLKGVWNGEKLNRIRELHEKNDYSSLPLCESCSRWNSSQYVNIIEKGLLIRKSNEYEYHNRIDRLDNWSDKLYGAHNEWKNILNEIESI